MAFDRLKVLFLVSYVLSFFFTIALPSSVIRSASELMVRAKTKFYRLSLS